MKVDRRIVKLTQTAAGSRRGEPSHEVDAFDAEKAVKVVIVRYPYLVAVGVLQMRRTLAAFFGVIAVKWIW